MSNHVHFDVDACIASYRQMLDDTIATAKTHAKTADEKRYIDAQHRMEIARLEMERSFLTLVNEGFDMKIIFDACGGACGSFLGSKLKTIRNSGLSSGMAKSMLDKQQDALASSISNERSYNQASQTVAAGVSSKPMQGSRA